MVSLKISCSISSVILKPLKLPERKREEEGGSSFPVWCLSGIFHWPVTQCAVIASRTHQAGRGALCAGYRAPFTGCCIPASSLTQEPVMTKWSTRINGGCLDPFMVLISSIRTLCAFALRAVVCICAFYFFWWKACEYVDAVWLTPEQKQVSVP